MKCICVNGSDICCYINVSRGFRRECRKLPNLEMIADGAEKAGVVGKYELDSDQRK